MRLFLVVLIIVVIGLSVLASPAVATLDDFSQAKRLAAGSIYVDRTKTFYCDCLYIGNRLDLADCGYRARKRVKRARRIEWEHIVPASRFGKNLSCWKNGGRNHCRRFSAVFRQMEADLINLVPTIGEVNGDRSNYSFGLVAGEKRVYGACDMEIDFRQKRVEPRPNIRGDIARIYFLMSKKYNFQLSLYEQQLFTIWDRDDIPDEWERERLRRISTIQSPPQLAASPLNPAYHIRANAFMIRD